MEASAFLPLGATSVMPNNINKILTEHIILVKNLSLLIYWS
jgi:hypothetical protein